MSAPIRLVFATDLHGSSSAFQKLLAAARDPRIAPDAIILGGDLSGKRLIPVELGEFGSRVAVIHGKNHELSRPDAEMRFEAELKRVGAYSFQGDEEAIDRLLEDRDEVERILTAEVAKRLDEWVELAERELHGLPERVRVFVTGGNDDADNVVRGLPRIGSKRRMVCVEEEVVQLSNGFELLSFGHSNPTPWKTPRELEEWEIGKRLDGLGKAVTDWRSCILNVHVPPYHAAELDLANQLTDEVEFDSNYFFAVPAVKVGGWGEPLRHHVGSQAVREFIENNRPLLTLVGHIHEACGKHVIPDALTETRLGLDASQRSAPSLVINPGSVAEEGQLRGYFIVAKADRVNVAVPFTR